MAETVTITGVVSRDKVGYCSRSFPMYYLMFRHLQVDPKNIPVNQ